MQIFPTGAGRREVLVQILLLLGCRQLLRVAGPAVVALLARRAVISGLREGLLLLRTGLFVLLQARLLLDFGGALEKFVAR